MKRCGEDKRGKWGSVRTGRGKRQRVRWEKKTFKKGTEAGAKTEEAKKEDVVVVQRCKTFVPVC